MPIAWISDVTRMAAPSTNAVRGTTFEKQTTRQQAVYGRLLEDPMTKVLFAANKRSFSGREVHDGAADSMHHPSITRPRPRSSGVPFSKQLNRKQAVFGKLLSDVSMTRMLMGTDWSQGGENIKAVTEKSALHENRFMGRRQAVGFHSFAKQMGRVDYHIAGLRSAPPKTRAVSYLESERRRAPHPEEGSSYVPVSILAAHATPIPDFGKALSREKWTSLPLR